MTTVAQGHAAALGKGERSERRAINPLPRKPTKNKIKHKAGAVFASNLPWLPVQEASFPKHQFTWIDVRIKAGHRPLMLLSLILHLQNAETAGKKGKVAILSAYSARVTAALKTKKP